jgi:hypothetical protein
VDIEAVALAVLSARRKVFYKHRRCLREPSPKKGALYEVVVERVVKQNKICIVPLYRF